MYAKAVLVVALVFFLGQVSGTVVKRGVQPYDIFDEAQARLDELEKVAQEASDAALDKIEGLPDDIGKLAEDTIGRSSEAIKSITDDLNDRLDGLRDQAEQEDRQECLVGREQEIQILSERIEQEIRACVETHSQEAEGEVRVIVEDVRDGHGAVRRLERELQECERNDQPDLCAARLIVDIILETDELPIRLQEDTDTALELVGVLEDTVQQCADDRVGLVGDDGDAIIKSIQDCIEDVPPK